MSAGEYVLVCHEDAREGDPSRPSKGVVGERSPVSPPSEEPERVSGAKQAINVAVWGLIVSIDYFLSTLVFTAQRALRLAAEVPSASSRASKEALELARAVGHELRSAHAAGGPGAAVRAGWREGSRLSRRGLAELSLRVRDAKERLEAGPAGELGARLIIAGGAGLFGYGALRLVGLAGAVRKP